MGFNLKDILKLVGVVLGLAGFGGGILYYIFSNLKQGWGG